MSILNRIEEAHKKSKEGKVLYFPFPKTLGEFSKIFPGRLPGDLTCITGNTASAKSSVARHIEFTTIEEMISKGIDYRVVWFALEETIEQFEYSIFSYVLYKYSNGKLRYNVENFLCLGKEVNPKHKKHLEMLESKYQKIRDRIKIIDHIYNSYGIYTEIRKVADKFGTFESTKSEHTSWDKYIPNVDAPFIEVVIDHISLVSPDKNEKDVPDAMKATVGYMRKIVTKQFKYSVIIIQQQAAEMENLDHIKEDAVYASLQGLGDSKVLARDYMNVIGITNLHRYSKKIAKTINGNVNIESLGNYSRVISVLKRRFGRSDFRVALYFDGCCNWFEPIDDINKLEEKIKDYQ